MSSTIRVLVALAILQLALTQTVNFTSNLFWQVVKDNPDKNVVLSPYSIDMALTLTYFGAEGETAHELANAIGISDCNKEQQAKLLGILAMLSTGAAEVILANRIFVSSAYTLRPTFNELISKHFNSEAQSVNFDNNQQAAAIINKWMADNTNNKISNIIKPESLNSLTAFVIANAIYFKAAWAKKFNERLTSKKPFWITPSRSVDVDTMVVSGDFRYADLPEWGATAVEVPYHDSDISLVILLPNTREGLAEVEQKMASSPVLDWSKKFDRTYIKLLLPKFKIESGFKLNDVLKALGVQLIFSDNADLSGIVDAKQPVHVSEVEHKAYLSVDEKGSEATGATIIVGESRMGRFDRSQDFVVDHPFIFFIRNVRNVYFVGHVVNL